MSRLRHQGKLVNSLVCASFFNYAVFEKGEFMRWIASLLLTALLSTSLQGAFSGFYFSAMGGVADQHAQTQSGTRAIIPSGPPVNDLITAGASTELAAWNGYGEIAVGLSYQWGRFLNLGGRMSAGFSSFDLDGVVKGSYLNPPLAGTFALEDKSNARMKTAELALDFKPGVTFHELTLFFGLIGAAFNTQSIHTGHDAFAPPTIGAGSSVPLRSKKSQVGLRLGFGLEEKISRHLALQLIYVYTSFPKVTAVGAVPAFNTLNFPNSHTADVSAKMRKQTMAAGLGYYF